MNGRRLCLLTSLFAAVATNAQDLTHPTRMSLPESDFRRPDPADYQLVLDNGLVAYVAEADEVPLVTLSAFVRAGKSGDTSEGAAETLLYALQNAGPADASADAFQDSLIKMTANYKVDMHDEWAEISLNVPTEDIDEALDIFAGLIRAPAISDAVLAAAAEQAVTADQDLGAESGPALYEGSLDAAVEHFYDVLYAEHPYNRRPTPADFARLTVDDVRDWHAKFFVPGNMTLAVAGDLDAGDMQAAIEALFGDMPFTGPPSPRRMPAIGDLKTRQHNFPVDKLQSWLVFGHELPQVPLADQAPLEVMNYILAGGHLYTRMTVETRYRYGYTNDASGFLDDRWSGPGGYNFRTYSRHDVIKPIYDNMMAEVDRIQSVQVSEEDLFIAKGALADGAFQVRYLDGYAIARSFAIERLRHGNHSRSATYVERVRAVTADDVIEAANKYIHPERMQVILVGKPIRLLD